MTRTVLYMAALMLMLMTSCGSSHHEPRPRPTIDIDELELCAGESADIHVSDAEDISADPSSDVIAVYVDSADGIITVEALREGLATVFIRADGSILHCYVKVSAGPATDPDNPAPEEPVDNAVQLADATPRYVSTTLTMRYDTPGTIVACYSDRRRHTIRSLVTGDCILFDTGQTLAEATLTVNGSDVGIAEAVIADRRDGTVWYRLLTARWKHTVWIVVPQS